MRSAGYWPLRADHVFVAYQVLEHRKLSRAQIDRRSGSFHDMPAGI